MPNILFRMPNPYRQESGPGVSKDDLPTGFFRGFFTLGRLNRMLYYSLLSALVMIPIMYFFLMLSKAVNWAQFTADVDQWLEDVQIIVKNGEEIAQIPFLKSLLLALLTSVPLIPALIAAAVMAICFGPFNCGLAYCFRNHVRGDHVWISDVFTRALKNWKQGLFFALFDLLATAALVCYIYMPTESFGLPAGVVSYMRVAAVCAAVLYIVMRFYIYTMIVTFDMRLRQIFKNAMMFVIIGLPRNIIALIGILAVIAFIFILPAFANQAILFVALFMVVLGFALLNYISAYFTYPVLHKMMVQPALDEQAEADPDQMAMEPVMADEITAERRREKRKSSNYGKKKR